MWPPGALPHPTVSCKIFISDMFPPPSCRTRDYIWCFSHLLQCHHVHGGGQRGDDHPHPQLPPQDQPDPPHALLGETLEPDIGDLTSHSAMIATKSIYTENDWI